MYLSETMGERGGNSNRFYVVVGPDLGREHVSIESLAA